MVIVVVVVTFCMFMVVIMVVVMVMVVVMIVMVVLMIVVVVMAVVMVVVMVMVVIVMIVMVLMIVVVVMVVIVIMVIVTGLLFLAVNDDTYGSARNALLDGLFHLIFHTGYTKSVEFSLYRLDITCGAGQGCGQHIAGNSHGTINK